MTVDRFLDIVRGLPDPVRLTDDLILERDGAMQVAWAPFEYVPKRPVLALVGITPGRSQAERALAAFRDALRDELGTEDALRRVKALASFSGPLRNNLVAMLDHIGLHRALGIASCADLFGAADEPVHFTSALRYPVFVNGANYSGAPDLLRSAFLRRWVDATLGEEARGLPDVVWVPLGPKPARALHQLAGQGLIDPIRILDGLPHPSGANAERIAFFLDRKPRVALSKQTNAAAIAAARERLRGQISAL